MRAMLLAFVASLGGAGAAHSSTIAGGSISITHLTDYSTVIGSLAKFDTGYGTLTGVSFTVGYGFNSTITISATTDSKGSVATESAAQFSSTDASIKAVLDSVVNTTSAVIGSKQLNPAAYDIAGTKSIYYVGPSYGSTSHTYTSSASASNTYAVSSTDFTPFLASGTSTTFDVLGTTLSGLNLTASGGNASAQQQTTATQNISVLYTYAPGLHQETSVPEPASLALLGAGLIAAGMIRRRST